MRRPERGVLGHHDREKQRARACFGRAQADAQSSEARWGHQVVIQAAKAGGAGNKGVRVGPSHPPRLKGLGSWGAMGPGAWLETRPAWQGAVPSLGQALGSSSPEWGGTWELRPPSQGGGIHSTTGWAPGGPCRGYRVSSLSFPIHEGHRSICPRLCAFGGVSVCLGLLKEQLLPRRGPPRPAATPHSPPRSDSQPPLQLASLLRLTPSLTHEVPCPSHSECVCLKRAWSGWALWDI